MLPRIEIADLIQLPYMDYSPIAKSTKSDSEDWDLYDFVKKAFMLEMKKITYGNCFYRDHL